MSIPDLPVELWLEILSFLPRSALHRMVGINRTLFELALNDLYEEVRFISDDRGMRKVFKQLKHAGIAGRVRHLFIRPAFLPGMDEDTNEMFLDRKLRTGLTYVGNLLQRPSRIRKTGQLHDPTYEILSMAKEAVRSCPNLRELTIILHDLSPTPIFVSFLNSLWRSDSIGPNLRKLVIDTTLAKLPLLLDPLIRSSKFLANVDAVDITIAISRFENTSAQAHEALQAMGSFIKAFEVTLVALSISCVATINLSKLFRGLPRLPKARKLELLCVFNYATLPQPEELTKFIAKHADTLEHLVIKPRSRQMSLASSDDSYAFWLSHNCVAESKRGYAFPQLAMPHLRTLDVGLRDIYTAYYNPDLRGRQVMTELAQVSPRLTSLTLTDLDLSYVRLLGVIDNLHKVDGVSVLEKLKLWVDVLSPFLFDLFSKKLPRLAALEMRYCSISDETVAKSYMVENRFYEVMQARRYPKWGLRYLRITQTSVCSMFHPHNPVMRAVAKSLSSDVILDASYACECTRASY